MENNKISVFRTDEVNGCDYTPMTVEELRLRIDEYFTEGLASVDFKYKKERTETISALSKN